MLKKGIFIISILGLILVLQANIFNNRVNYESKSHNLRMVILNKADKCIKNAKTMDQYKECEKVEQEERRKGMRNLQIEKKQMIIDNLNSKIKKTTDFRNCIQEATTNQEMKNCRPKRIKE